MCIQVAVVTEINNNSLLQFLVSLCAIVGGLVTVMRYLLSYLVFVFVFVL